MSWRRWSRSGSRSCSWLRTQLAALESEARGASRLRALLDATTPDADGVRRVVHHATTESRHCSRRWPRRWRPKSKAVLILVSTPSVVLGSSADSGVDVGALLKAAIAAHGGKGGGSPRLAQGVVPSGWPMS